MRVNGVWQQPMKETTTERLFERDNYEEMVNSTADHIHPHLALRIASESSDWMHP